MNEIRRLSPSIVNKIAAGEVIERPASVVKELVENSLDAGATRIDVTIEKGGMELIRVADNGHGIPADQLHLAAASHATSKICDADDLFRVETLGFRGEALASIASVSRLELRSRCVAAESAAEIEIVGGEASPVRPAAGPQGTTITVGQLFFNTPVRKKFMRTVQTEMGHVSEAITRLALAHPEVAFSLRHGGRTLREVSPQSAQQRVESLFGAELAGSLIPVESDEDGVRLTGFAANPTQSRPNNRMQYLFLNGRFIRDRSLQHALGEAYRGLLLTGRFPICMLHLSMPPAAVDVNVHPCKLEVRFQEAGRIYSQLLGTLRTKFLSTDLVARASLSEDADEHEEGSEPNPSSKLLDWARRQARIDELPGLNTDQDDSADFSAALRLHRIDRPTTSLSESDVEFAPVSPSSDQSALNERLPVRASGEHSDEPIRSSPTQRQAVSAMQIHSRYLVTETDDGLIVIDQHALHERILYEALREKVLAGAVESQRLLVPEPVDLPAAEAAALLDNRELLSQLGVEVEPFGGETVLVAAYPAMLANFAPTEVVSGLVEKLMVSGGRPERRDVLDDLLHMIACKAAVKYGDRLTSEEIDALLAHRELAQDHHHCPHGRPTALVFTREQLDRQFKRV